MRMRGIIWAGAALALCAPAMASNVAYVDYAKLMHKAPQVAASGKLLEHEFAPRLRAINKQEDKLKSLAQQLSNLGPGASSLKRASLIEDYRHAQAALKKTEQSYRSELGLRREQLRDNFRQVVDNDIKAYAEAHGIDVVVKEGGIYAAEGVDLTAAILKQLREDYRRAQAQQKGNKSRKP